MTDIQTIIEEAFERLLELFGGDGLVRIDGRGRLQHGDYLFDLGPHLITAYALHGPAYIRNSRHVEREA